MLSALLLAEVSGVGLLDLLQGLTRFLQVLVKAGQNLCCQDGMVCDCSQVKLEKG